jgi:TPR repeat protein
MPHDMDRTHLTLVGSPRYQLSPSDRLLLAVRQELGSRFDVYGELGRGEGGKVAYLARDLVTRQLVALQLIPTGGTDGSEDYDVHVALKLDPSVPTGKSECPRCHAPLKGWGQFCRQCGANLSGRLPTDDPAMRDRLQDEVKRAARGRYEIIGEMENAQGEGVVYFGRAIQSGELVALRLMREGSGVAGVEDYSVGVTQVLGRIAAEALGNPAATDKQVGASAPPVVADLPITPTPAPVVVEEPTPEPVIAPKQDERFGTRSNRLLAALAIVLGAIALVAIVALLVRSPGPQPVKVDSVEVQLGAALPAGALATIDGTPFSGTTRVPTGQHVLSVVAPGFDTLSQQVTLRAGQSMLWMPSLTRQIAKPAEPTPSRPRPRSTTGEGQRSPSAPVVVATCASLTAKSEWSRAIKPCEDEATRGSASAHRALGTIYERGLGVDVDFARAVDHYRAAADRGDAFAQYRLGSMYASGTGVKRDDKQAADLYRRAADQGQTDAAMALGNLLERGEGVRRDRAEAMRVYQRAADLGDARAQYRVAQAYASGDNVPRDDAKALDLFQKSANQGNADAQFRLGEMYAHGQGVSKSDATAQQWYQKAAAQGHQGARKALGLP